MQQDILFLIKIFLHHSSLFIEMLIDPSNLFKKESDLYLENKINVLDMIFSSYYTELCFDLLLVIFIYLVIKYLRH